MTNNQIVRQEYELDPQLEARLIEQDHRLLYVLENLWRAWRHWPKGDPRRRAAFRAFFWKVVSPGAAAASVGIVAIATVLIGLYSAALLRQQNRKLDQQTYLAEASRTAALAGELGAVTSGIANFASESCEIINGKVKVCWAEAFGEEKRDFMISHLRRSGAADSMLASVRQTNDFRRIQLDLPSNLAGRLTALTNGLRPYRFLADELSPRRPVLPRSENAFFMWLSPSDDGPQLIPVPLSIERGMLVELLTRLAISLPSVSTGDFRHSDLREKDMRNRNLAEYQLDGSDLGCSNLSGTLMTYTSLRRANLQRALLRSAELRHTFFQGADLSEADFRFSRLPDAISFSGANLAKTYFEGAEVPDEKWLEAITKLAPKGFDASQWKVAKRADSDPESWQLQFADPATKARPPWRECR